MIDRRTFLKHSAAAVAVSRLPVALRDGTSLTLTVNSSAKRNTIPADFTGLSYEAAQLGHPRFFSARNHSLIALFRRLAPHGVLRIGGNTAEYTTWSSDDRADLKNHTPSAINPDAGTAARTASILTPQAIDNLRDFLDATGWRVIYGLNLRHGTPEMAAAEAAYVQSTLKQRLLFFQIGNEPDLNHADDSKQRWTFDHYWKLWRQFHAAVLQAVPEAQFGAPDIASRMDWLIEVAEKRPDIAMLTGHYYAEGPPKDPKMTIEYLLHRGKNPATQEIPSVHQAVQILGKPFRMSEGNSCYDGGKPGVSDTFASALWCGDYMLQVAQAGYVGVNLHGGGDGFYTPIAGSESEGFVARPIYYGMLLTQHFDGSTFLDAALDNPSNANVTAFAGENGQRLKIAIFNKDPQAATIALHCTGASQASKSAEVYLLQAPAIDSKSGVTFGGASVSADGNFTPRPQASLRLRNGKASLNLPAYTAALVMLPL